ncbi:MAG TPA: hypothetical protein VNK26_07725 [Pyrinomonadaceae bacterium]|nr:hypothetical protein [Pyrinomonadaceae bacterium]
MKNVLKAFTQKPSVRRTIEKTIEILASSTLVGFIFFGAFLLAAGQSANTNQQRFDLTSYGVRIEPDQRVMIVLATLEAARTTDENGQPIPVINTPLSKQGRSFRELLASDLAALSPDLRQRISTFVLQHKRRYPNLSDAELVAPFISMAYSLSPPPELADPVVTIDLPGNLLDVLDFAPLVRDFYRRSSFSANLAEYVKLYNSTADANLRPQANEMVKSLLDYLHTRPQLSVIERIKTEAEKSKNTKLAKIEIRERERRFFIVPELLAPAGTVNFINVRDDYFAVISPEMDLKSSGVRRAFLQFVIDPIVLSLGKDFPAIRDKVKPLIEERLKKDQNISPDVILTISKSLVSAADIRENEYRLLSAATREARAKIDRAATTNEKAEIARSLKQLAEGLADESALRLSEDYEKGSILNFYFYDQLKGVEESGFDISAAVKEILLAFDPQKETGRYEKYAEARQRAAEARKKIEAAATKISQEDPLVEKLLQVQKFLGASDYQQAKAALKEAEKISPGDARIYYAAGRIYAAEASAANDPEAQNAKLLEAKLAYENVIRISQKSKVDSALLSLSYVALAKIYEFFDQKSYAVALYDAAIKLGRIEGGAYDEAVSAREKLAKDQ